MERDALFATERAAGYDFAFDDETARVFDDMLVRSVPFYHEIQRMVVEMATEFAVEHTNLYDLGCSTGTTLLALDGLIDPNVRFIGVDNSEAMLKKARAKLAEHGLARPHELRQADLHQKVAIDNASVVILLLTLQFVRPFHRARIVQSISRGLNEGGCLLVVEKVTVADPTLNRLFTKHHHAMKHRNGYSKMEIARKREALENVLFPHWMEEHRELLLEAGFRSCEEFFRWYNFAGFVAIK